MANDTNKEVVVIEFDNSKFDKNIKKSSSALDEFKSKFNFSQASKGVDVIAKKIKMLDVITFSVINNITNRVINLGAQMIKSLSVDNISSGWDKFGAKTTATATIMAQSIKVAGKAIEDYAEKTELVNEQLERLLWFTDETSYNFTDMVESIGKFTAAGVDLDVAVKAMEGIATWAAKSGQNAAVASRAMAQLAQTLGKGYVQLIDWRSIQNANMDTQEFRQTALETAVALGQLTKQGTEFVSKAGKKITSLNFTDSLADKWFTSDVLNKTLEKYAAAVDDIYALAEKEGITAYEVIEKYGDTLDSFGVAAFKAAQECRTLNDALNSIKDAVSTGWMTTFELFIGKYDEAKEVWSGLADSLYDSFVQGINFRNTMLKVWKDMKGNRDIFGEHGDSNQGAFWNIYDAIHALHESVSNAWNTIFPKSVFTDTTEKANDLARQFKNMTESIRAFTNNIKKNITESKTFQNVCTGIFTVLRWTLAIIQGIAYALSPLFTEIKGILFDLFDRMGVFGVRLSKNESVLKGILNISRSLAGIIQNIVSFLDIRGKINVFLDFIADVFNGGFNADVAADGFKRFFSGTKEGISRFISAVKESGKLGEIFDKIISAVQKFFRKIKELFSGSSSTSEAASGGTTVMRAMMAPLRAAGEELETEDVEESINWMQIWVDIVKNSKKLLNALAKLGPTILDLMTEVVNIVGMILENLKIIFGYIAEFDFKEFVEYLQKNWLNLVLWGVLISLALHAYDLFYDVVSIVKGWRYAIDLMADNFELIAKSLIVQGIAANIRAIGRSMLEISIALAIVSNFVDQKIFNGGLMALITMVTFFTVFISTMVVLSALIKRTSFALFDLKKLQLGINISPLLEIAKVIRALGFSVLAIVAATVMLQNVDEAAMDKITTIMLVLTGISVFMVLFSRFASKNASGFKRLYPGFLTLLGISVFIRQLGKTFAELANEKIDAGAVWLKGILPVILILGMMTALASSIAYISTDPVTSEISRGSSKKKVNEIFKSIAGMLASLWIASKAILMLAESDASPDAIWEAVRVLTVMSGAIIGMFVLFKMLHDRALKDTPNKSDFNDLSGLIKAISRFNLSLLPLILSIKWMSTSFGEGEGYKVWAAILAISSMIGAEMFFIGQLNSNNQLERIDSSNTAAIVKSISIFNSSLVPLILSLRTFIANLNVGEDWPKIAMAFGGLYGIIGAEVGLMAVVAHTKNMSKDAPAAVKSLAAFNISLTVLMVALRLISFGDTENTIDMIIGLIGIIAAMGLFMIALSKMPVSVKQTVLSIISLGALTGAMIGLTYYLSTLANAMQNVPVYTLAASIAAFGIFLLSFGLAMKYMLPVVKGMKFKDVISLTLIVGAFMGLLVGFTYLSTALADIPFGSLLVSMVFFIAFLAIFGVSMKAFSNIIITESEMKTVTKSLFSYIGVMALLGLVAQMYTNFKWLGALQAAASMIVFLGIMFGSIAIMKRINASKTTINKMTKTMFKYIGVIASLSFLAAIYEGMNWVGAVSAAASMIVFLGIMFGSIAIMKRINASKTTINKMMKTIISLSSAIVAISLVALMMNKVSWESLGKAGVALAGLVVVLEILKLIAGGKQTDGEGLLQASVGLLAISMALVVLCGAFNMMADVDLPSIGLGLLAIAGGLTVLLGAAFIIQKLHLETTLVLFAAVLATLSLSLLAAGVAISLFAANIEALPVIIESMVDIVLASFAGMLKYIIESPGIILEALFALLDMVVEALVGFVERLASAMERIKDPVLTILDVCYEILMSFLPKAFAVLDVLIKGCLKLIKDNGPEFIDTVADLITYVLKSVKSHIGEWAQDAFDIVWTIVSVLWTNLLAKMGDIVNAVFDLVITVIDKVGETFARRGAELGRTFVKFGKNLMKGLWNGIIGGLAELIRGIPFLGNTIADSFQSALEIHSPSRMTARMGRYLMDGFAVGMEKELPTTRKDMSQTITDCVSDAMENAEKVLDDSMENGLVITPTVDLSNIVASANDIERIMSNPRAVPIIGDALAEQMAAKSNGASSKDQNSSVITNNNEDNVYHININVTTNDPEGFANEFDALLRRERMKNKAAKGGV